MPRRVIPTDLRDLDRDQPVKVYWNIHQHRWSVSQDGKVRAHLDRAIIHVTDWRVQPAGNARVRRERRKHVHAYAIGYIRRVPSTDDEALRRATGVTVRYDPYKHTAFMAVAPPAASWLPGGSLTPAAARPPADYLFGVKKRPDEDPSPRVAELRSEQAAA